LSGQTTARATTHRLAAIHRPRRPGSPDCSNAFRCSTNTSTTTPRL
jgi:hypothetical protein